MITIHVDHAMRTLNANAHIPIRDVIYANGEYPPNYPVPALRTDMLYWRMSAFPTSELVAQWFLCMQR